MDSDIRCVQHENYSKDAVVLRHFLKVAPQVVKKGIKSFYTKKKGLIKSRPNGEGTGLPCLFVPFCLFFPPFFSLSILPFVSLSSHMSPKKKFNGTILGLCHFHPFQRSWR